MMHWMVLPYRRYFDFSGRSRRMEYWMFVLFQMLVSAGIGALFGSPEFVREGFYAGFTNSLSTAGGLISNIFGLISFIPGLAVAVRRLHDQDRTGWLLLLVLIPILGWFALLVLMCLDGTPGSNRFGADPKNPTDIDVFA